MEYIDDECDQDHSHQNVDKTADIRGITSRTAGAVAVSFSIGHLPDNKERRLEAGVGLLACVFVWRTVHRI